MALEYFTRTWFGSTGNDSWTGFDQLNPGFTLGAILPAEFPGSERIFAGNGDDTVSAGGGNDSIEGAGGNDLLSGGANNDTLNGGAGLDVLLGGQGDDLFLEELDGGGDSAAEIAGGEGIDVLQLGTSGGRFITTIMSSVEVLRANSALANITLSQANFEMFTRFELAVSGALNQSALFRGVGGTYDFSGKTIVLVGPGTDVPGARFLGSAGEEVVTGTARADFIDAGAGPNKVSGGEGNDDLRGAGTLRGGADDDTLRDDNSAVSNDSLVGDAGNDSIISAVGADTLVGGIGDDTLQALGGGDLLLGGEGADRLQAGSFGAADSLYGGAGDDLLIDGGTLGVGAEIHGGAGHDTLDATGATLNGVNLSGIETLRATTGLLTLSAEALAAFPSLDLGAGVVVVAASTGRYDFSGKTMLGTPGVVFQGRLFEAETVLGGAGADSLVGFGGDDSLVGGGGNDTLNGGGDNDRLEGGAGFDVATYFFARANYTLTALGNGLTQVSGAEGTDTLSGIERLVFGDSIVELAVEAIGTGRPDSLVGAITDDTLTGLGGNDTLDGQGGYDRLLGNAGDDELFGGTGRDFLNGGDGNDLLVGGVDADLLVGGAGADRFRWDSVSDSTVSERDLVRDFNGAAGDRLDLSGLVAGEFDFIGSAGFAASGAQVRTVVLVGGRTRVEVSLDGGPADMVFQVDSLAPLGVGDFLL